MAAELRIDQVSANTRSFFRFPPYPEQGGDPAALADCYFYDLHVAIYDPQDGTPDRGTFEEFFPTILRHLTGQYNTLTLNVRSADPNRFAEYNIIESLLAPRHLRYALLSSLAAEHDARTSALDQGQLFFEWPADALGKVAADWFFGPVIDIEGYISPEPPLGTITELYFRPDTTERAREFIRHIEIGFNVWPDNDGLFLVTDKLAPDALTERLQVAHLNAMLEQATRTHGIVRRTS